MSWLSWLTSARTWSASSIGSSADVTHIFYRGNSGPLSDQCRHHDSGGGSSQSPSAFPRRELRLVIRPVCAVVLRARPGCRCE